MTKLRRLDPQPEDLTTHKGPFVSNDGDPARIALTDFVDKRGLNVMWAVLTSADYEDTEHTDNRGFNKVKQLIFAAEEIPEPMERWLVFDGKGNPDRFYNDKIFAVLVAEEIGGTYAKFVEVLETEDR